MEINERVTISTHGSNLGTVQGFQGHDRIIVQMDGEPAPRLCLMENVHKVGPRIMMVYVMDLDLDHGPNPVGVVHSFKEAKALCKENAYLSFREEPVVQIGNEFFIIGKPLKEYESR